MDDAFAVMDDALALIDYALKLMDAALARMDAAHRLASIDPFTTRSSFGTATNSICI